MAVFQTKHLWIKHLADGVAALVLDRANSPVNFLDLEMLDDLARALDAVTAAKQYHLLIVRSAKRTNFCHGVSSSLLRGWHKEDFERWAVEGQKLCNQLSDLPIPSVAVISGSCFDAGLELALACDYRVAVNRPATAFGFPVLEWGMIPCWGGTQRLPHLVGLETSFRMLLGGQTQDAHTAWVNGLVDDLSEEVGDNPPAFLADPHKRDWTTFPRRSWRESLLESNRPGRWLLFRGASRVVRTRVPDEMPAPAEMLQALRTAYDHPSMQQGLDCERQALRRVDEHPSLHHLLRLLGQREKLRSPTSSAGKKEPIQRIGILGGGVAALSLLLHAITSKCEVVVRARDEMALGAALTHIVQLLQAEVQHGSMSAQQYQKALTAIRGTYTWNHFDKLDLVVDTVAEPLEQKKSVYEEMEHHLPASAVVAALPHPHAIADLRPLLQDPGRLVGLRIVEPWNRGSLAELVVPAEARPGAAQAVQDWLIAQGKCALRVPDRPLGLAMRVWLPALNEAGLLLREGVGIGRIDDAMKRFGMTYGPFEWMDRLGVDQVASLAALAEPMFQGRISFETGFALMVEKQWLGNRTAGGFYRRGFGRRRPSRETEQLWRTQGQGEAAQPAPALSQTDSFVWIQERLVTLMILEALRCLEEGYVSDGDELDCALCLTGWATHRGGPVGHARQLGEQLLARCTALTQRYGPRFAPLARMGGLLRPQSEKTAQITKDFRN
jgi:3-hydroxyacyl-CoA dehydrogenase/enoyl-CoA hydratase/3-hydroxybutyryl-CoA epimerase